jgi:hypothetical protein
VGERINLSIVISALTIISILVGAGMELGKHSQMDADLQRRVEKLEQVFTISHPITAEAFGLHQGKD